MQTTHSTDQTYRIHSDLLPEVQRRAEILNRRVRKTGHGGLSIVVERTELATEANQDGFLRVVPYSHVRIVGEVPRVAGFTFAARIEHHGEIGNIVSRAPGAESIALPASLRTDAPTCDHCNLVRRRSDTFALVAPDGNLRRVGRNCLADFLRGENPELALRIFALLSALHGLLSGEGGEEGFGGSGESYLPTTAFLAHTSKAIRSLGWVSRKAAREIGGQATADVAIYSSGAPPRDPKNYAEWLALQPEACDVEEAGEVVAWAATLADLPEPSDYEHNLRVAIALGYVSHKNAGIVASAVPAMRRELEREVQRKAREARPDAGHFGEIKKRYTFDALTVTLVRYLEGTYGTTTLLGLEDSAGHAFKWFASGSHEYSAGDRVRGKGTVKSHDEYKGRKQTSLTRCAFETIESEATAAA